MDVMIYSEELLLLTFYRSSVFKLQLFQVYMYHNECDLDLIFFLSVVK